MKSIQDSYVLSNGNKIPCVAFGTWRLPEADTTVDTVKTAIDCGYRHVDTAFSYYNEVSVGKAVRTCGIKRNELFVTTKLSNGSHGYEFIGLDHFQFEIHGKSLMKVLGRPLRNYIKPVK